MTAKEISVTYKFVLKVTPIEIKNIFCVESTFGSSDISGYVDNFTLY